MTDAKQKRKNELKRRVDALESSRKNIENEIQEMKAQEKILTSTEQKALEKMKIAAEKLGYRLERDFEITLLYKERELQRTRMIIKERQNQLNVI